MRFPVHCGDCQKEKVTNSFHYGQLIGVVDFLWKIKIIVNKNKLLLYTEF